MPWNGTLCCLCLRRYAAILSATAVALLGIGGQVSAQAPYEDLQTSEGWAWAQIKEGKEANFNTHCGTSALDPQAESEIRWTDACRRLTGAFFVDVLTRSPWREQVPFSGISVVGARVEGDIDLSRMKLDRLFSIARSRIENDIHLDGARTDSDVSIVESRVAGNFSATQLHSEMSLLFGESAFKQQGSLNHAKIDGYLDMTGVIFDGNLDAGAVQVGADLVLGSTPERKSRFKEVNLRGARVTGDFEIGDADFSGDLLADALQAHALFMRSSKFRLVILRGAKVTGDLIIEKVEFESLYADALQVGGLLLVRSSAIFNNVRLRGAKVVGDLEIEDGTRLEDVSADALQVGALFIRSSKFRNVSLGGAKVTGDLDIRDAIFERLFADALQVGASMFVQLTRFMGDVRLRGAKVAGNLSIDSATFEGDLYADALQVGPLLLMTSTNQNKATFKNVDLSGAKIAGNLDIAGVEFEGDLNADALQVGGLLLMRSNATFKQVNLRGANAAGSVQMSGAIFNGDLDADALQVGVHLLMLKAVAAQPINMAFARISGNLDIRGATLAKLNLSGASIAGDLRLGPLENSKTSTFWRTKDGNAGDLILRNTRVANLMDAEDAWPDKDHLHLDGFTFARLGGSEGDSGAEMRSRPMKWWDGWARRDPVYSPAPYEQLAAAFAAVGDRDAAEEIRYLGRVRQRKTEGWLPWIFSGFLQYAAGFGIGGYTFRVLYLVIGIAAVGAIYLWTCVQAAREHGPTWCFGASLARLLPVIEINKEFTDFFDDPNRTRLTAWQSFVFSGIAMAGWVLGAILVAAVSGLTQKP
jgi:uncharacterized protein YjbI with pentapeptide repeats